MIEDWRAHSLHMLSGIASETELFNRIAGMARELGFEYCSYGIRMPVPITRPAVAIFCNYSAAWWECYQARNYIDIDPTVKHGLKSTLPVVWSNDLFVAVPDMWEEARSHGLQFGWAQASHDPCGAMGLLTLARSADQLTESELRANEIKMAWLSQFAHAGMTQLLRPKLVPETRISLTTREREVLRWTAEGKTAYEIARILTVSERTVNFHVNNVVVKLGTSNKTQAAVKAAALGMLV